MARQIITLKQLVERQVLPFSADQIRKLIRRKDHPLPFKKAGKLLLFDVERIGIWFDALPGQDSLPNRGGL